MKPVAVIPRVAVLISGGGSNLAAIISAVEQNLLPIKLETVIADRDCAGKQHAFNAHISFQMIDRKLPDFAMRLNEALKEIDWIVLAGFLSVVPSALVERFPRKIINLHPSLLPKFGGMGMYGMRVHQAVLAAGESESGCTVHFVDNGVDTGEIIAQASVPVLADDVAETLAKRVQQQEHLLLVKTLQKLIAQ